MLRQGEAHVSFSRGQLISSMQYFRTTATFLNEDIVDGIWWLLCKDEADKTEDQDQDQPQCHTSNEEPHSGKKASLMVLVLVVM